MTTAEKTAADFRLGKIERVRVNGKQVKRFEAFARRGDAFIFVGTFNAPAKTADSELWRLAAADGEGGVFLA